MSDLEFDANQPSLRERFLRNLQRVRHIVEHEEWLASRRLANVEKNLPSPLTEGDLLRASVVLLHSTLEDLLRSVAASRLPTASPEILGRIPFPRVDNRDLQRKTTFTFEDLAVYRGRTVDFVIETAVDAFLERSNYNNLGEIVSLLIAVGLDPELVKPHARDLTLMITRRHAIVHQTDSDSSKRFSLALSPIDPEDVTRWAALVEIFGESLLQSLGSLGNL